MFQTLHRLRRTNKTRRATTHSISLALLINLAHSHRPASRAMMGEVIGLGLRRTLVFHHAHDLRDHIARTLHHNRVANADILARDLIFIVQRRIGDDDATHRDGLEFSHRRQGTRATDLDFNIAQDGDGLFRREFMGLRPARRARHETKTRLRAQIIHLVNNTVDIITEL